MKSILGLDLGSNSVGWSLVQYDSIKEQGSILGLGSRVIPMDQATLGEFGQGNKVSQTSERTRLRQVRRLIQRRLLRRERLHRVLNILGFLPEHFQAALDFDRRPGQFAPGTEPKLAYRPVVDPERNTPRYTFIFKDAYEDMLTQFRHLNPGWLQKADGSPRNLPYDWTIYHLRKKAITEKIEKEELAWLLLHFNQKRGYYQARGEEEEDKDDKDVQFHSLTIVRVDEDKDPGQKGDPWYSLTLDNGWVYRRQSRVPLFDWVGKTRDFIVTTDLDADGTPKTDKEGNVKRSFRAPGPDDWTLQKKKTERDIEISGKTVGTFIFDTLLQQPRVKIKGKLIRTIERRFYKDELKRILQTQLAFHPELTDRSLLSACINELYRHNEPHRTLLLEQDFVYLLVDDILFYQRPLLSKKSEVGNCSLEFRPSKDKKGRLRMTDGKPERFPLKAVSKSNPYYQEFRLWQWLQNLRIYRRVDDADHTAHLVGDGQQRAELFGYLNSQKEIVQEKLLRFLFSRQGLKGKQLSQEVDAHYWNFVADKAYPGNETRAMILSRLGKCEGVSADFLDEHKLYHLWHIIYSVTDREAFGKAIRSFAARYQLDKDSFYEAFKKTPPFDSAYGSFSEKAIRKLLPLMRLGSYWSYAAIDPATRDRIDKVRTGEYDEKIRDQVRKKAMHLQSDEDFQGLPLWLAQYLVYDRHAEAEATGKWNSLADIDAWLNAFRQYSLRNMVVEQVVLESMRVVRDIWERYGHGAAGFFDEIHIELGRELRQTNEERQRATKQIQENEATNQRIKHLLAEMYAMGQVENVRPYSPVQQELLKIYEEGVLRSGIEVDPEMLKIAKTAQPGSAELRRYILWLEQKYMSPYTGQVIPLSRLFTPEYEIEHIIPQSRYFDDSMSNKVICEAAVNKLKDNLTGLAFIEKFPGQVVELGFGKTAKIFEKDQYKDFVLRQYASSPKKRKKLLMEDIPEEMVDRQLNDTRYIGRLISQVLSNLVRSDDNDDGVNSKNVVQVTGKVTAELRQDWGLNDVWNDLILPRFERMNVLLKTDGFTAWNEQHQRWLPTVPLEFAAGFSKKRIDHRHHALDALVIACTTRGHVNYLNNRSAREGTATAEDRSGTRYDLRATLCYKNSGGNGHYKWTFKKPWPSFTADARTAIGAVIVSHKQQLRVLNRTSNRYTKWVEEDGQLQRRQVRQEGGSGWAIRKPLHKDTVYGAIRLRLKKEVSLNNALDNIPAIVWKEFRKHLQGLQAQGLDKKKILAQLKAASTEWQGQPVGRVEIWYWDEEQVATRKAITTEFDEKTIESVTDGGIQKILLKHLHDHKDKFDDKGKPVDPSLLAFSPEGIDTMNQRLKELNNGADHQPITKVRLYEPKGNKFNVGETGSKRSKFVEAAKSTNLYFGVYQDEAGKRNYATIPLIEVVERLRQRLPPVPETNEQGDRLIFTLSPNDLVYVPKEDNGEIQKPDNADLLTVDADRIYRVVSFTGNQIFMVNVNVAVTIVNKVEFSALNKMERAVDGTMIKVCCHKLSVDRLGNISMS